MTEGPAKTVAMGDLVDLMVQNFKGLRSRFKTQEDFGDRLGISQGQVSNYITGKSWTQLNRLEGYLIKAGLDPDERLHLLNDKAIEQMDLVLKYEAGKKFVK